MKTFEVILMTLVMAGPVLGSDTVLESPATRFAESTDETPDFQRHVVPLLGKLGCNGRSCHGSFQGRGGFRLSLFGYDFESDHDELAGRSDAVTPSDSLILQKPLMEVDHEGGRRFEPQSWQHHLLQNWIKADSPGRAKQPAVLTSLVVSPSEILFTDDDQEVQLTATAVWSDGTQEDVTALCRFQTNDDQIAGITSDGLVAAGTSGDTHLVVFYDNAVVPVPVLRPVSDQTDDQYPNTPTPTEVDRLVVSKLRKLGIVQSDLCSDEEFLRRASLDATGTLPTADEVRAFVADTAPDKRSRKIDELLERPGYVAWWTTRLCDFTGNSDDQLNNVTPIRTAASQHWYDWIHTRVENNTPYDEIAEGMVLAVSRDPGESYEDYCENMSRLYHKGSDYDFGERETLPHYWSRRNFQKAEDRVIGFSYAFLGIRIQCAQCHKHPFDQWTQQDFRQFQGFFTGVVGQPRGPRPQDRDTYKEMLAKFDRGELKGNQLRNQLGQLLRQGETVPFGEVFTRQPAKQKQAKKNNRNGKPQKKRRQRGRQVATKARLLGSDPVDLTEYTDIRQPLMEWLRSSDNPLFARAFVNRVWANYFNVGIVNPPDDLNLANPPSNAALLDYLSDEFIAHEFDMKWLHREIMNSRTYQLSWKPNDTNQRDERNFSHAVPRRLPAEVSWDIVSQAVSNDETFAGYVTSMNKRAVAVPGSGLRRRNNNPASYALSIFGRSVRDSNCDCDRSEDPSLLQTIFLRNDNQILALLDSRDSWLAQVAGENNIRFTPQTTDGNQQQRNARRRKQLSNQLKGQQKRLKELREKGASDKQIKKVKARIKRLRTQISPEAAEDKEAAAPTEPVTSRIDVTSAVNDAYLRTLSRSPTENEFNTAAQHIEQSPDQLGALRDVMWVLLNTKEFIVNH